MYIILGIILLEFCVCFFLVLSQGNTIETSLALAGWYHLSSLQSDTPLSLLSIRHLSVSLRVEKAISFSRIKENGKTNRGERETSLVGCAETGREADEKNPQNTVMMRYDLAMATALTTPGMSGGFPCVYIYHWSTWRSAQHLQNQWMCKPVREQEINLNVRITLTQWWGNIEGNNERPLLLKAASATR